MSEDVERDDLRGQNAFTPLCMAVQWGYENMEVLIPVSLDVFKASIGFFAAPPLEGKRGGGIWSDARVRRE